MRYREKSGGPERMLGLRAVLRDGIPMIELYETTELGIPAAEVGTVESTCAICGEAGSVRMARSGVNRGPESLHDRDRIFCRSCARARGAPIPASDDRPPRSEPAAPSWDQVAQNLRQYEHTFQTVPDLREMVLDMARKLWRYSHQIPGAMPPELAAGFQRLGVGEP